MAMKIKVHERCAQEDTPPTGGLPPGAPWEPPAPVKIKTLKKDDLFTLKPIENPKESQVWCFQGYDRTDRTYWAIRWDNISVSREFKGDKDVYTEFNF